MLLFQLEKRQAANNTKLRHMEEQLQELRAPVQAKNTLQSPTAPVTRGNELLFHSIAQAKIKQSTNGTITAQGLRGRLLTLLEVPLSEKSSHLAGRHPLQQQSQTVEK